VLTLCFRPFLSDSLDSLSSPHSIQTWALQEAKARMEARGEATEYKTSA
jgi:hypothetical protein